MYLLNDEQVNNLKCSLETIINSEDIIEIKTKVKSLDELLKGINHIMKNSLIEINGIQVLKTDCKRVYALMDSERKIEAIKFIRDKVDQLNNFIPGYNIDGSVYKHHYLELKESKELVEKIYTIPRLLFE